MKNNVSFVDFPTEDIDFKMIKEYHIYLYVNRGISATELIVYGTINNYQVNIIHIEDRGMKWGGELTEEELCQAEYGLMEAHENDRHASDWTN
jgi:hypothetical protein